VPEDLSREELIALVKAMAATNTALQTTVEALTATINGNYSAWMHRRLSLNGGV